MEELLATVNVLVKGTLGLIPQEHWDVSGHKQYNYYDQQAINFPSGHGSQMV